MVISDFFTLKKQLPLRNPDAFLDKSIKFATLSAYGSNTKTYTNAGSKS